MSVLIENPFAGVEVGWTWAQHVANRYQGGTDYIWYPANGDITAAADGTIALQSGTNGFTPGPAIILKLADGRTINYREVHKPLVKSGQVVHRGDPIGVANNGGRWPHIDATVKGVRVPFEPLVNVGTDPAGGGGTPVPIPQGDESMIIYTTSSASTDGVIPAGAVFLQGDDGPLRVVSAGEKQAYDFWNANGIPYRLAAWTGDQVRAVTKVSGLCQWNADFTPTGKIIYSDPAKATYPPSSATATVANVDFTPILTALTNLTKTLGADTAAIQAAISAVPGLAVKAEAAALGNG